MTAVGQRRDLMICTRVEPPEFPSRACSFGHRWREQTKSDMNGIEFSWLYCRRCGAKETWSRHDKLRDWEATAVLEATSAKTAAKPSVPVRLWNHLIERDSMNAYAYLSGALLIAGVLDRLWTWFG
jgi:hypothetical protein